MRVTPFVALAAVLTATLLPVAGVSPAVADGDGTTRVTGTLLRTAAEPGAAAQAAVATQDEVVPVESEGVEGVPTGSTVTLDVATDTVEPAEGPVEVTDVVRTSATARSTAPSTRQLTVVPVVPKGVPGPAPSTDSLAAQVEGADAFWRDNSRGTVGMTTARVLPAYAASVGCGNPFVLWDEVAEHVGWTRTDGQSLVLLLPGSAYTSRRCAWGMASLGTSTGSGGYVYVSGTGSDVLAHEVGHNMSLLHANELDCGWGGAQDARATSSGWPLGCDEISYSDGQDVMGVDDPATASGMLSTPQALRTGMLEPSAAQRVDTGTTRVTLRPLAGRDGVRAATVRNELTRTTYYVEYRTPAGRDLANAWGQGTGVRVLRRSPHPSAEADAGSILLDPTPTGEGDDRDTDVALARGRTWRSHDGEISVRTVSTSSTGAVVEIAKNLPRITGSRGVGKALTASTGAWSPTPVSSSYRWYRDGSAIAGATGRTYTPTRSDAGRSLSVRVTAQRPGLPARSATSTPVGIPVYNLTRPYVRGTARVGRTVTVMVGSWTPRPTSYTYQWYRGSTRLAGATSKSHVVRASDAGTRLRVRVTARRGGSVSGVTYSTSSPTVTR